jgi:myo-inositol catabolism protein IolS
MPRGLCGAGLVIARMRRRPLGKTGLLVSEIGVGAWQLGGPLMLDGKADGHPELGRDFSIGLIREVGELGVNFIDTAEQYGNGESERRVGEALKGRRGEWVISTKFGAQVGPNGERENDVSPGRVARSLEDSLRRLRTDYIDVYLYHTAPKREYAEEVAALLLKAKEAGKVRAVGISTIDLKQVEYLESVGCLDVVQYARNMVDERQEFAAWVRGHGAGAIIRGAFAAGKLSGRYFHAAPKFESDDIRQRLLKPGVAEEFAKYAAFEELVTPERGMVQLTLRWLLDDPGVSTIIPGGKCIEDYQNAIRATELPGLTEVEGRRVAEIREGIVGGG